MCPGRTAYFDLKNKNVSILSIKNTLKDRYSQIKAEVNRPDVKIFAFTMDRKIAQNVSDDAFENDITFVVPTGIQRLYRNRRISSRFISFTDYLQLV